MASINKISVKNIKRTNGHDGASIWQCDIYRNGKKLGHAAQDFMDGYTYFNFDENVLEKEIRSYVASDFVDKKYKDIIEANCFIDTLVKLTEDERLWKKGIKYGYRTFVKGKIKGYIKEGYYTNEAPESIKNTETYATWIASMQKKYGRGKEVEIAVTIYSDSSQFEIVTA